MARSEAGPCSSCAYWEAYPAWEGVGVCVNTLSRNYSHMTFGAGASCEFYSPRLEKSRGIAGTPKRPETSGTICVYCHYWFPSDLMPRIGQCYNPSSRHFEKPTYSDKPTEDCFVTRTLEGQEFLWCQSHRQTIYITELPVHKACSVFISSASLPVEDQAELTLPG